jgi:hypothetical protein
MQLRPGEQYNPAQSRNDALMAIGAMEQQVMTTGRTDSERTTIHDIRVRLYQEKITPEQAMEEIERMISKRQDYN